MIRWCKKWKLHVNINKSNVIHFRPVRRQRSLYEFKLGQNTIQYVECYRYLGILLDEHLKMNNCVSALCESANRALGGVISKFKQLNDLSYDVFIKLYETGVIPVVNYGAGVWGYDKYEICDKLQNKAMCYFLGVSKFAPTAALIGDLNVMPIMFTRWRCIIQLWNRLLRLDSNRLTKRVFLYDRSIMYNNWSSDIKSLLDRLDLEHVFENNRSCNITLFNDKCFKLTQENWLEQVNSKPKLRTYKCFKSRVETEDYVKCFMSRAKRSLFAQIRFGILPLEIETGRYYRKAENERLCKLCNMRVVENEIHFVMLCQLYNDLRMILFSRIINIDPLFMHLNTNERFNRIMNQHWREFCNVYLVSAWCRRKAKLFM